MVTSRFCIKGGQLDLPVGNVTFFASKEVIWISQLETSRFLHQRRLVGPCVGHITFFCTKGGLLGPPVGVMMFSGPQLGPPEGCVWLFVTLYPHHQSLIGSVCLSVKFYPHHQFNRAERCRRKGRTPQNCILARRSILGLASRRSPLA